MENNCQASKRRGRPAGSKNRRNRVPVTTPSETIEGDGMVMDLGLHLNMLEVPAGHDVIAAVYDFANRHQLGGVSVINTHGFVRKVILYQPNTPKPLFTYKKTYQLLSLMGSFYGSSSSIRPMSLFPTRHVASFVCDEGFLYIGTVQGKLTAATNVVLGLSFINGTESIKLPPHSLRALPATGGLLLGAGRPRTATAGLTEFSSGAGGSRTAYSFPTVPSPSPSPLISWNMLTSNFSSISGSKDFNRSTVRENLG